MTNELKETMKQVAVSKDLARMMHKALNAAAQEVFKKYNMSGKISSIKYGSEFSCKVRALPCVAGKTIEQMEFEKYAVLYNLQSEDYGRQVLTVTNSPVKIVGIDRKASKYSIVCEMATNGQRRRFMRSSLIVEKK